MTQKQSKKLNTKKATPQNTEQPLLKDYVLKIVIGWLLLGFIISLASYNYNIYQSYTTNKSCSSNLAKNHCLEGGNKYEVRKRRDNSKYGVCVLPNQVICEEWTYYNGECPIKHENTPTDDSSALNKTVDRCSQITDMNECTKDSLCVVDSIYPRGNIGIKIDTCISAQVTK